MSIACFHDHKYNNYSGIAKNDLLHACIKMIYFLDYSFENDNFVPIQRGKKVNNRKTHFLLYKVEVLGNLGLSYEAEIISRTVLLGNVKT